MKKRTFLLPCFFLLFALACGEDEDNGQQEDPCDPAPTFTQIQEIFDGSCTFSSCHAGGSPSESLSLETGGSCDAIVEQNSTQMSSVKLVDPGDAQGSYLYLKIKGDTSIQDDAMPPPSGGLSSFKIDRIKCWINNGATCE